MDQLTHAIQFIVIVAQQTFTQCFEVQIIDTKFSYFKWNFTEVCSQGFIWE